MLWRIKIASIIALTLIAGLVVSASCSALNQPDDLSVALGVFGLLVIFIVFPWMLYKIINPKDKPDVTKTV